MNHNMIETILGAVVLAVAAVFLGFALSTTDVGAVSGYKISAKFSQIMGIAEGQDVRIAGVKVGSIVKAELDKTTYQAKVTMAIDPTVQLPTDTVAKVSSEGLLGGKYLALEPGADEEMLKNGDEVQYTQSAANLEELIGKFIFNGAAKEKETESAPPTAASPFNADE